MIRFTILTVFVLLFSSGLWAQEIIRPLKYNQIQEKEMKQRAERLRHIDKNYRVNSMELPFIDDFSTDKFPGNEDGEPEHWLDFYAYKNNTYAIDPPSIGVVTFDGADEYGYPYNFNAGNNVSVPCDTLTSVPINLDYDPSENIYFSFFFQGKGYGESPDDTPERGRDSLVLQFYAPQLDQWFYAWSTPGYATGHSSLDFEQVFVHITQNRYLRDGFQFRFVNYGNPSGSLDHWHIDYIQLDRNRSEGESITDVAYVYPIRTLLEDYSSMPWKHFVQNPSAYMADDLTWQAYNLDNVQRTIFGRTFEIYYDGVEQGNYINESEPPIPGLTLVDFTEPVQNTPFNFTFDTNVNDTCAVFDYYLSNEISPDFIESNNQMHMQQEFYSYYAYDDGSPERAWGSEQQGARIALRYVNMMADSLIGLSIWFEPANDAPGPFAFFPMVWEDAGTDGPGDEIVQGFGEDIEFYPEQNNGWRFFKFLEPVYIPAGGFFVGVIQTVGVELNIGLDYNSNKNNGNLYWFNSMFQFWSESSAVNSSLMIRPVFQAPKLGPVNVAENALDEAQIFPNPANDELFINPGTDAFIGLAEVLDLTGKIVRRADVRGQSQVDLSGLTPGMYLLRVVQDDQSASRVFKFVKN